MTYRDYVEEMASTKQNKLFLNSGPIHAAIVMSRIFKHADKHIEIFCGGFTGAVSNDEEYLKYLESFLKKGGILKILVEEDLSKKGEAKIYSILKKYPNNVNIRLANGKVINEDSKEPVHFAIADDRMSRLETGTMDYTAQVNFDDKDRCKQLSQIFTEIWTVSDNKPIALA